MWFKKKEDTSACDFWQQYEEKTEEKVLSKALGKYISGWDEFDEKKHSGLWGLLIKTSGGFRFLHFTQHNWIDALTAFAQKNEPKEKSFFIPNEKIISLQLIKETKWWKRLFSSVPFFVIRYTCEGGAEKKLLFEVEYDFKV